MEQSQESPAQQSSAQGSEEKRPGNDSRKRVLSDVVFRSSQPPKAVTTRQRWDEFRPSKAIFFWTLVAVVALTMMVGFIWGGWMTSASAQKMANTVAKSAVVERLAPICVAQFNLDPDKDAKLLLFQQGSAYERTKYVTDQAWATLPGDTK